MNNGEKTKNDINLNAIRMKIQKDVAINKGTTNIIQHLLQRKLDKYTDGSNINLGKGKKIQKMIADYKITEGIKYQKSCLWNDKIQITDNINTGLSTEQLKNIIDKKVDKSFKKLYKLDKQKRLSVTEKQYNKFQAKIGNKSEILKKHGLDNAMGISDNYFGYHSNNPYLVGQAAEEAFHRGLDKKDFQDKLKTAICERKFGSDAGKLFGR